MHDLVGVAAIAAACAAVVGLAGLVVLRALRGRPLRYALAVIAIVTVLAVVSANVATGQLMFLSPHDLEVVVTVSALAGLAALVVALILGGQIMRGSRELETAARALGAGRAFRPPPDPPTAELAGLSRALEAAGERLASSRAREHALEESRRELIAWVSHDLRTPLAGLRAMAEALEDGLAEDPARYHRQIRVEVDRLAAMVDDLFELSRIHAGSLRLSVSRLSLADLVSDTLAGTEPLARARGVRLLAHAAGPVPVTADPAELSRVLSNLVVNAIRHTPADGTVEVHAASAPDAAVLAVTDGCGGIPEPELERVFDVAWRGTPARTPGPDGGAGLGLAIARGIVEAHRGSISVANMSNGCRFEVRLPLGA